MIVLCDNREQNSLEFIHPYVEEVQKCTLLVGDYTVRYADGHTPGIIFERKSITDVVGTFSKGYKRFLKEIKRSKENNIELIVIIEGTVTDLLKGTLYSQVQGIQILRTLLSVWNKYKIISIFSKDRKEMALFIAEFFCAYQRNRLKNAQI